MCGISGIYNVYGKPVDIGLLQKMTDKIRHRGPDDEGYLLVNTVHKRAKSCYGPDTVSKLKRELNDLKNDISANLGFSNRRLAVLDLSMKGHQPMSDHGKRVWITYNGEIYNYRELREELIKKKYKFRTETDTEVILNAYLEWGIECQSKFRGMWAFAIWDSIENRLFCSRDRFGIKPFYYFYDGDRFIFGSEIKQFLHLPINRQVNEKMLYRLMKMNSFLYYRDESLFEEIKVLPHSHYILLDDWGLKASRYYDLPVDKFERSALNLSEAVKVYKERLTESVSLHLRSDLEVGSCLSGGLDSSAILALASGMVKRPVKTFTAYYTDPPEMDERDWIAKLHKQYNFDAHYISPGPEEFISDFERITYHQECPVIGSSPVSQYYVMQLASVKGMRVILDGQGSDEINCGYAHAYYRYYADLLRKFRLLSFVNEFPAYLKGTDNKTISEKIIKTMLVAMFSESFRYRKEIRHLLPDLLKYDFKAADLIGDVKDLKSSRLSSFLYHLIMTIFLQSLLHFEDRNSMAFSIESRVPFLDHKLVEFMFSLPSEFKISGSQSKKLHRYAMSGLVPDDILNRKDKVNFATPAESFWLKEGMNNFLKAVLWSDSFRQRGIYNQKEISNCYRSYMKGACHNGTLLWRVVGLEVWLREFADK